MEKIYLSGEDVCRLLHISKRTLQQYRDDNILPFIQIGGKIIYNETDLVRILEENYRPGRIRSMMVSELSFQIIVPKQ